MTQQEQDLLEAEEDDPAGNTSFVILSTIPLVNTKPYCKVLRKDGRIIVHQFLMVFNFETEIGSFAAGNPSQEGNLDWLTQEERAWLKAEEANSAPVCALKSLPVSTAVTARAPSAEQKVCLHFCQHFHRYFICSKNSNFSVFLPIYPSWHGMECQHSKM